MNAPLRKRALLIGLGLGLLLAVVVPDVSAFHAGVPLGMGHFPLAPFFITAWLFVYSGMTSRGGRTPVFFGTELLAMWAVMTIFATVSYSGLAETFLITITAPDFFAGDAYRWTDTLRPLLPESWFPSGPGAAKMLYNGLPGGRDMSTWSILQAIPWGLWVTPLAGWALFIALSFGMMLSLARLFGPQWVTNERMNFPLLRTPQLMGDALDTSGFGTFMADRFLWAGVLASVSLHTLNGLHFYIPSVPEIPTLLLAGTYFPKFGLFSGFHKLKLYIIPAFIGFAFLTPRQVSFSLWFFHLLALFVYGLLYVMGLQVPESALGVVFAPEFTRPEQAQAIGAYAVFALFIIWLARGHLRDSIRSALPGGSGSNVSGWPVWGLIACMIGLAAWSYLHGMPLAAALALPCAFLLVQLVAARIICQGGLARFTATATPIDGLTGMFGADFFGKAGLAAAAIMQKVLFADMREAVTPTLMHAQKPHEEGTRKGRFTALLGISLVLASVIGIGTMLVMSHKYGIRDLNPDFAARTVQATYEGVQRLTDVPTPPNRWILTFAAVGAGVMFLLVYGYYRAPWWPLHPIGYLAAYGAGMKILWFGFFVGWLANHLCLHYGGTTLFRKLRLLFAGLVLGDFLIGGVFAAIGIITGESYHIFPL